MTDKELFDLCWNNVRALPQEKINKAVQVLRENLSEQTLADLKERIAYDREGWLGGWDKDPCMFCANGLKQSNPPCSNCKGTGFGPVPLHSTWGMGIRNLLRRQGCNEEFMGINNWDDYYVPICELAAGFGEP